MSLIRDETKQCAHCEGNLYNTANRITQLYCGDCHCLFNADGALEDAGSRCDTVDPLDMRNDHFTLNEIGGCECIMPKPQHRQEALQPRLLT